MKTEQKTNRTQGEWEILENHGFALTVHAKTDDPRACDGIREICEVKQGGWEIPDDDEARANARLIAAAPQLLDALRELAKTCDSFGGFDLTEARQAIAAATGEGE